MRLRNDLQGSSEALWHCLSPIFSDPSPIPYPGQGKGYRGDFSSLDGAGRSFKPLPSRCKWVQDLNKSGPRFLIFPGFQRRYLKTQGGILSNWKLSKQIVRSCSPPVRARESDRPRKGRRRYCCFFPPHLGTCRKNNRQIRSSAKLLFLPLETIRYTIGNISVRDLTPVSYKNSLE